MAITAPLAGISGLEVLVIGAGLGEECARLAGRNRVDAFELPGELREFLAWRDLPGVEILDGDTLPKAVGKTYDLAVAIDVLEHIHPDEWAETMDALAGAIRPGGALYCHNNFTGPGHPEHYDNTVLFAAWCAQYGFTQETEYVWRKR